MKGKEAAVIKVLSDIGMTDEPELTPKQEQQLERALDPEKQFLYDVEKLFDPQVCEAWYDDEDAKYDTKNPIPFPSEKLHNHAYEVGDNIDKKIIGEYKRVNNIQRLVDGKVGEVLKQGHAEIASIEIVPINKIMASERMLDGEHLQRLVHGEQQTKNSPPRFLKIQDKYFAEDGNHRIAAAYLRGEKGIKGLVLDTSGF